MLKTQSTILIVDDDNNICHLLAEYLTNRGYHVITSSNGWDCLWEVVVNKPDGIILDLQMPKMDGIKAMDLMRLTRLTEHIPVLIASAQADKETIMKTKDLGADDFVVKPYSFEELTKRLERLLFPVKYDSLRDILQSARLTTIAITDWSVVPNESYRVWNAHPTLHEGREVCVLLPNDVDLDQAMALPEPQAVLKIVVLAKFHHHWKCVWPNNQVSAENFLSLQKSA